MVKLKKTHKKQVLSNADKIGCRKFLTVQTLIKGNSKLNLAFVANLFNTYPNLKPLTKEEKTEVVEAEPVDENEMREARGTFKKELKN